MRCTFLHRGGASMHQKSQQTKHEKKKRVPEFPDYMNTYILTELQKEGISKHSRMKIMLLLQVVVIYSLKNIEH